MQQFALECSLWKRVFWELIKGYLSSSPTWLICCLVETCSYFIFHLIQRFQTFAWDPKRVHCLSHFYNIVHLVDYFLCTHGHHASLTKLKDYLKFNYCFKSVWNASAEDVWSSLCCSLGVSRITFTGHTNPGCMGFVSLGLLACKVGPQSHYVPIFQRTFPWKGFLLD